MKVVSLFFKLGGVFIPFLFSSAFIFQLFSLVVIEGMKGGTRRLGGRKDPTLFGLVLFNQKIYVQLISLVMFFFPK